ncbi:tpr repeat protein [Nannochloropsis gaditana CCMP526]|uniref:tpr repeat protein n=1 Tax=Nannochloropsis gaditana (strain CCMP526) TaxID=1093141 RepID=UPI00029F54E0|nr:tpr repeat protein [Nannochloropsis gaditana CCMP526]EKU21546.1 tpr repeat protein [Nannochloropsis gaditana CCMP526]|eukprot:XP_005854810.1 tpr repeat protein [Nannochloropsis gaditana CCMP526]
MPSLVVGDQIAAGTGGINQALAEGRGWSDEDVLAYAKTIGDNHPMFAETLEEMDPAMVDAIQAIKLGGKNAKQLALQAKSHGNELFGWGKKNPAQYSNCLPSYDEAEKYALAVPLLPEPSQASGGEETPAHNARHGQEEEEDCLSKAEQAVLLSQIYANRAMAHLMLKNYRSCQQDCTRALARLPSNVKAHYRLARACFALGQYPEAIKACMAGLDQCPASRPPSRTEGGKEGAEETGQNPSTASPPSPPPSLPPALSGPPEDPNRALLLALRGQAVRRLKLRLNDQKKRALAQAERRAGRRKALRAAWTMCQARGVRIGRPPWCEEAQGGGEARRRAEALPWEEAGAGGPQVGVWSLLLLYPDQEQRMVSTST